MAISYSGLTYQPQQAQAPQALQQSAYIPSQNYGQLGMTPVNASQQQTGAMKSIGSQPLITGKVSGLPNPIYTNIESNIGVGSGTSNAQMLEQGALGRYNQFERNYGQGATPWYLQDQSKGGYGGNVYGQNLFVGNNPGYVQAGHNINMLGSGIMQTQDLMRDPLTGMIAGYGNSTNANPFSGNFWATPGNIGGPAQGYTSGRGDTYAGIDSYFNDQLNNQFKSIGQGPWDVNNLSGDWKRQMIQGSMPSYNSSGDAFANWWAQMNNLGYVNEQNKLDDFLRYKQGPQISTMPISGLRG